MRGNPEYRWKIWPYAGTEKFQLNLTRHMGKDPGTE